MEQSKLMARLAYQALDDKKGEDIQVIDISGFRPCRLFYHCKRKQ